MPRRPFAATSERLEGRGAAEAVSHDASLGAGRLRLVATINAPHAIARILAHLGLPPAPPAPLPARQPSWLPAD